MTDASPVQFYDLAEQWDASVEDPLALFTSDDPAVEAGTYVIEPGERVPATGTTSHDGPELSVVLSGEIVLGLPENETERIVTPETFVIIPTGTEHYSANRGDEPVELVYAVVGDL